MMVHQSFTCKVPTPSSIRGLHQTKVENLFARLLGAVMISVETILTGELGIATAVALDPCGSAKKGVDVEQY